MNSLNPTGAGVETKVVASSTYGAITLVITWILTNYVFHGHMPADLANLLPGFVAVVAGSAAGWLSHHTPRLEETVAVVRRELAVQMAAQQPSTLQRRPAAPPAPASQSASGPTGMAK
jgi:hypothetical protein